MNRDAIAYAVNVENQGSNLVGDHALGVGELVVGSVFNFPATGSVAVGDETYDYTAVDDETNTITLSGVTSAAYDDDARVELSPASPVWFATVVVGSDQPGFNAMVPIHLVPMLAEDEGGSVFPDGIPVRLESISAGEFEWQVVDAPGRQPSINATTTPIIVTTDAGESVRIDGDGFSTYTNDPVPIRTIAGAFLSDSLAVEDGYVYVGANDLRKFDLSTGEEVLTGFPISIDNAQSWIAIADGFLYVTEPLASADIRKFNASTGAEVIGGGFPIAGTFAFVAAGDGFVYARDSSSDIRKFNVSNGVEVVVGFPIVGTFSDLAYDDGFLYALDGSDDIRKFDAATGVEAVSGFPITGPFAAIAASVGRVYASDAAFDLRRFDADDGLEDTSGYPVAGPLYPVAVGGGYLCMVSDQTGDVRIFNTAEGYRSTLTDSSAGTWDGHAVTVSDLTSTGTATFEGVLGAPGFATLPNLGHSDENILAAGVTPTSTTNIDMPDLTLTFDVGATTDVVWVALNASITITTAGTVNIVEMLLDGVADPAQLITRAPAGPQILAGRQDWRLTGLSAGSHTVTFRTRNAAATTASVNGTHTKSSYWTST
jgi:hypothetical protein